jgi:hypothetical protein
MRCDDVRTVLEEVRGQEAPDSVRGHLASCAECAEWWRAWRLVSAGFCALAQDSVPEPSWGFPERVLRRIQEAAGQSKTAADFLERAGRRVVWATLCVTLAVLLALVVPPSGPVRAASEPDNLVVTTASNQDYSVIDLDSADISTPPVQPAVEGVKK